MCAVSRLIHQRKNGSRPSDSMTGSVAANRAPKLMNYTHALTLLLQSQRRQRQAAASAVFVQPRPKS